MAGTRDPELRFSDRVEDYARYRPRYPASLIPVLEREVGLRRDWIVADIGSGTGLSAEPFLDNGNPVFAIEPNAEMRGAAERLLGSRPGFTSMSGSAEATGLASASVDLAVAGQAFHWFDPSRARVELARILRTPRWAALFWNTRRSERGGLQSAYESLLLRFGTDYEAVRHDHRAAEMLESFFGASFARSVVPNEQRLDYEALEGRLRSSSYTPPPGHPDYRPMLEALHAVFEAHQVDGHVVIEYETEIYAGRLG